jgi:hypothetical protein
MDRRNENGRDEQASAGGAEDEHMARARTLMRSVLAPREAREFVETNLCREHAFRALATVQLAATEFASQAVLSGSGPLEISLRCTRTTVTVAVRYQPSAALARQSLILTDELSSQVIQGISQVAHDPLPHRLLTGHPLRWARSSQGRTSHRAQRVESTDQCATNADRPNAEPCGDSSRDVRP